LIINYLITGKIKFEYIVEGFKDAAEIFAEEAEISFNNIEFLKSVDEHLRIHAPIENGKIEKAIGLINRKAPELLDQNQQLAFHLKIIFNLNKFFNEFLIF
jgi:hypothetical protein